jgi:2'-5' RNA ligase
MARSTRTFIALPIPNPLKSKLERLQRLIAPDLPGASWVEPAGFHLTLAFLGDVDDTHLNHVCKAVAEAVKDLPPFGLTIKGLGAFPDASKPRVLWAGITGDIELLTGLRKAVVEAVAKVDYPPDDDRFHPHITLGYLKVGRGRDVDMTPLEAHYRNWAAGVFTADSVVTYASTSTPEGPAYAPLGVAPLAKRGSA